MSKNSIGVKKWRNRTKELIIDNMGKCCQICSYNKCNNALELHHIDPSKKELSFGKIRANPISLDRISEELKKCILLCSNCHREIHASLIFLPEEYVKFDYEFIKQTKTELKERNYFSRQKKYDNLPRGKITISNEELYDLWINKFNKSNVATGKEFGVSEAAIRKRIKKHVDNINK